MWRLYYYLAIIDEFRESNLSIQLFMYEIPIHLKKQFIYSSQIANLRAHTTKHEVGQLWHQAQAFTGTTGNIVAVSWAVALATQLTGNILTTLTFFHFFFLQII